MRVVSILIRSLLIIAGIAVVTVLIGREVLLLWASSQLEADAKTLRQVVVSRSHIQQCRDKGSALLDGEDIATVQMRFSSDTEYVLEIVCDQYRLAPITVKTAALPLLVTKTPGSSGVIIGAPYSAVEIGVMGRHKTIVVADKTIETSGDAVPIGTGPTATCGGYGLTCCSVESEIGVGEQITQAADCPKSCFSQCQKRPVLLSLTAEPYIDAKTRTVDLTDGQQLTVFFAVEPGINPTITARLDFGDGTVEQAVLSKGSFVHTYDCRTTTCQYTAHMDVHDDAGVVAAEAPHNTFTVQITR
jgi:hypothetical protein